MDKLYRSNWVSPIGHCCTSGNLPHVRVRSMHPLNSSSIAPCGLPRNFYNEAWIWSLKVWQLSKLGMLDFNVSLDISEDME
jgi:hypothetical protein